MRSDSGFATQGRFDARLKFRFDEHATARPAGLHRSRRRGAPEWLVTNGRGSYAMGTVAGTLTRSYHGLLIAALDPPVARRLLVPSIQLEVQYRGASYALATNRCAVRRACSWLTATTTEAGCPIADAPFTSRCRAR
jgi:Glycogen debranching enzyme N terminal